MCIQPSIYIAKHFSTNRLHTLRSNRKYSMPLSVPRQYMSSSSSCRRHRLFFPWSMLLFIYGTSRRVYHLYSDFVYCQVNCDDIVIYLIFSISKMVYTMFIGTIIVRDTHKNETASQNEYVRYIVNTRAIYRCCSLITSLKNEASCSVVYEVVYFADSTYILWTLREQRTNKFCVSQPRTR